MGYHWLIDTVNSDLHYTSLASHKKCLWRDCKVRKKHIVPSRSSLTSAMAVGISAEPADHSARDLMTTSQGRCINQCVLLKCTNRDSQTFSMPHYHHSTTNKFLIWWYLTIFYSLWPKNSPGATPIVMHNLRIDISINLITSCRMKSTWNPSKRSSFNALEEEFLSIIWIISKWCELLWEYDMHINPVECILHQSVMTE